jgi:nucleoside-diphosphate-sugar epimerase
VKCLVSGATGFVGRRLCQQLLANGDSIIALSRGGSPLPDGTPTLALDLAVEAPGDELLQGVDVVFHLAGIAHQNASESAYHELNYLATVRLARQAAQAGVSCFVFLSSVKAMGPSETVIARAEDDCVAPPDAYGRSKWQAECALQEAFAGSPMSLLILRPALVYGAESKGNLALLGRAVRAGLPRPPEAGGRSMVALDDLVELLCGVKRYAAAGVRTWIVADGQRYTTRYIYDQLRLAEGKSVGRVWLPLPVWRLAAALMDRLRAGGGESTFSKLFGTELYSNAALLAATGWRPRRKLGDVINDQIPARDNVR